LPPYVALLDAHEAHAHALTTPAQSQSEAEKEELQEVVSRKLRVEGLTECGWYSSAQLSTLGTSAADLDSCLTAVEQFVTKHKRIKLWRQY
jgi:hypothetical protein